MATKQRGRPPIPKLTEAKLLKCYNDLLHVDMMDHKSVNAFCIVCDRLLSDYYEKNHKRIFNRTTKYKEWYQDILIHHEKYDEEYARQAYANYMDMMMLEARHLQLDSYLLLLEWNRPEKEKFYKPRRGCLLRHGVIQGLQDLLDDEIDVLSISLPPGTGKTTIEMFFLTGVMGWFPEDFNLFYSHSGDIVKMFYRGCLDIITNDDYQWAKIFPNIPLERTDAGLEQINVGKFKTFPSLQTTSVGSKNAGKVRASKFLCVDDMISGIDEALNRNTLDKLWNNYSVDARQRKLDGCKELHIATRWSVADIIGRLQHIYGPDYRARFIAVPDIDPTTKKSNFEYENGVGFSVEFFRSQAAVMDDISYRCLYKQEPIEREGLLYHEDELRRFDAEPTEEPDAVWAICDTKTTGTDYMFMPIISQYGDDFYCVACVCDNSTDIGALCEDMGRQMIVWRVNACEFESNAGGAVIASNVADFLKSVNWRHTTITTKPTETNKETRIIAEADWVKKNVLFRQTYRPNGHYAAMMKGLLTYSIAGKNLHDDVPDGFANLSRFLRRKFRKQDVEIIRGGLM